MTSFFSLMSGKFFAFVPVLRGTGVIEFYKFLLTSLLMLIFLTFNSKQILIKKQTFFIFQRSCLFFTISFFILNDCLVFNWKCCDPQLVNCVQFHEDDCERVRAKGLALFQ